MEPFAATVGGICCGIFFLSLLRPDQRPVHTLRVKCSTMLTAYHDVTFHAFAAQMSSIWSLRLVSATN